jgi:hypothetical protein
LKQTFPCPKCGAQIPVGQHFCSACGERFQYICGNCGAITETISGFCTNCGEKLHDQTEFTKPPINSGTTIYKNNDEAEKKKPTPQSTGHTGRYVILIIIIIIIGAVIYAIGTGSSGTTSNWFGNFNFGGESPPSVPPQTPTSTTPSTPPPTTPTTDTPKTPEPVTDLPRYSVNQVITVAKRFDPTCRAPTQRTG